MDSDSSHDPLKELTTSRTRYMAELAERLSVLRQSLARLSSLAEPGAELISLRRRLHALGAAAEVLRFTATAQALEEAETALASTGSTIPGAPARERVARILDLVPSLALGVPLDLQAELDLSPGRSAPSPHSVVVLGAPALAALLHKPGPLHDAESHVAEQPDELFDLVARVRPDVVVLDADVADPAELVPRLRQLFGVRATPLIAVGNLERPEPLFRLARRGVARVVPKPLDALGLQRAVRQVSSLERPVPGTAPKFAGATPGELVDVISAEARRAFSGPLPPGREAPRLDFQSDAEVMSLLWAAFARIRGLAAEASGGTLPAPLQGPLIGPFGTLPLAPAPARGASQERGGDSAEKAEKKEQPLRGRTLVVAIADLSVLTLVCKLLEQLGASLRPARDGAQALEACERFAPDALICDTLLPGLDGFELCRRLRQDLAIWDLPVALLAWKDYLLERARSASKEGLDPSCLAPALERCLQERTELEAHVCRPLEVRGRLQGQSARYLLELVRRRKGAMRLSLRDAKLEARLAIAEGRIQSASLHDGGVQVSEGAAALGPFLGMRAGRFRVEPVQELPEPAHGNLDGALEAVVSRARRARVRLAPSALSGVERVQLDASVTTRYLTDTPSAPQGIISALLEGAPLRLPAARAGSSSGWAELSVHLLELVRRGAVLALFDRAGNDVLAHSAEPALGIAAPQPDEHEAEPAVAATAVAPAELDLGEAVFEAVRSAAPPEPEPEPSSPPVAEAGSWFAPGQTRPASRRQSSPPRAAEASAEADAAAVSTHAGADAGEGGEMRGRSRGALAPVLVTLGAALVAFLGMRALSGGVTRVMPALPVEPPAPAALDAGATRPARASAQPAPAAAPARATGPLDDANVLGERRQVSPDVSFEVEQLDLPLHAKVRPGHGLLEVRAWEPRQIYVDGVFMGNYATRLIPLGTGTYQLRLGGGDKSLEHAVEVQAGRRTRLIARPKAAP